MGNLSTSNLLRWQITALLVLLAVCILSGCSAVTVVSPAASQAPEPALTAVGIVPTPSLPTVTATPVPPTATPTGTPTPELLTCVPLAGFNRADLPGMVSNPYHPPAPGSDDPHHGVDLAVRLSDTQVAVAGNPVLAAFGGQVAAVIIDRFPYGNAVIIETSLDQFPSGPAGSLFPTPAPTLAYRSALTCPDGASPLTADLTRRSLYVLYAHLKEPPALQAGDQVACGQQIGLIGSSGNALNPHLHFEARTGPSGVQPGSMAHYDASATADEMRSYCQWRISGLFQLVDPLKLLEGMP